ncbi:Panacea domain-containing protein [Rhizobium sp. LCM 4573]|uniref:Panacea domain-containing protein n=1 Tax=Rhizobium sp. LCM 4573 TaxID=1848291 RepID=UPI0012FFB671|nr:Panacea domain-containing protein [Rhizobium sp. LCM 4573]
MDKEKAVEALVYIASKIPGVGRFHAAKILYFAELRHLREYGRPVVGDRYIAMENGPVPSFAYDVLKGTTHPDDQPITEGALVPVKGTHYPMYEAAREPDLDFFSESDIDCLEWAVEYCRNRTFGQISDETHTHPAWDRADLNTPMDYADMLEGADPQIIEDAKVFSQYGVL